MDHFSKRADALLFTAIQFIFTGLICVPEAIILETTKLHDVYLCLIPLLYAGLLVCAVGYTCQMVGQKYVESARATVLISSETLFSLLSGMLYYNEMLTAKELIGCVLMFSAIILAETQKRADKRRNKEQLQKGFEVIEDKIENNMEEIIDEELD